MKIYELLDILDDYYYIRKWYEEACEENNEEERKKYWIKLDLIMRKIKEAVNDNIGEELNG